MFKYGCACCLIRDVLGVNEVIFREKLGRYCLEPAESNLGLE